MSEVPKAVFLSYASQDAEAAKRICEALRAAGVEVWFDQSELVGGDQWDAKIRGQIGSCALFLPVISANTQSRLEGYFRLEWKLAAQRTHTMADEKTFLLPILIDGTRDAEAKVPAEFKAVQWTKLPGGETPPAFVARVGRLLAGETVSAPPRPPPEARAVRPKNSPWFTAAIVVLPLLTGLILAWWVVPGGRRASLQSTPPPRPPTTNPAGESGSKLEVTALLARVRAVMDRTDTLHTEMDTMEDLLGQAARLDPADAAIWVEWALLDCRYLSEYYDPSTARREAARRHVAQAAGLDPGNPLVRLAQASVMRRLTNDAATKAEAVKLLRLLLVELPDDGRVPLELAVGTIEPGRPEAASEWFDRAAQMPGYASRAYFAKGRAFAYRGMLSQAKAEFDRALASEHSFKILLWKAYLLTSWDGDLAAARQALKEVPPQFFVEDMPAATRYYVELLSRNYDQALAAMRAVPHDYMQSVANSGPTGFYKGYALALAGKPAAAELEWRSALATVERRLVAQPNDQELMQFKALTQVFLGERTAAAKTWQAEQELYGSGADHDGAEQMLGMQLLPADEAFAGVVRNVAQGSTLVTAAQLRLDPVYDPIRSQPGFPALLARAEADPRLSPNAKAPATPSPNTHLPSPSDQSKVDQNSVAVLAFANLSDDKANEYFSDGISEELLNVLAKIPGLKVAARTSAFYFKGKEVPVPEIAKQLGVAYVVEGSVRKSGDKVRITAQLIKAADGFQVWSDTFTRDVRDIFAVQDEIAGLIAENLKLKMGDIPRVTRTVNPEAHRLVLEGRHFWNLRTTEGFTRAEAAFTGAIELDPQFAEAHAGLADNFQIRAQYKMLDGVGGEAVDQERAWTEGQTAFRLDPSLPETNAALAYLLHNQGKLAEAEGYYKKAFALNPNYAVAHLWHGQWLDAYGRLDAAIEENRLACELDPLGFIILDRYAQHLALARRYHEALAMNERAAALRTDQWMPNVGARALILFALGRNKEAVEAARTVRQNPASWPRWTADADALWVLRQSGLTEEAGAYTAELLQKLPEKSYVRGFVLINTGRFDEAMPYLERSPVLMRRPLFWDPSLDQWREDPRFHQLLAKLGCAEEYKVARDTLARMLKDQATKK